MFKSDFAKKCVKVLKANSDKLLSFSFLFLLILAATMYFNSLIPFFALVSCYLFLIPFLFSLQFCVAKASEGIELNFQDFNKNLKGYFSPRFRGIYGMIPTLFKSFLLFIVISIIGTIIYGALIPQIFTVDLNAIMEQEGNNFLNYIYTNIDTLYPHYNIFMLSIYGVGFFGIFVFLSKNLIAPYFSLNFPVNPQVTRTINRVVYKKIRKDYNRSLLSISWPGVILYFVGYAGGSILGILCNFDIGLTLSLAFALGLLLTFPFFALYLIGIYQMYVKYKELYQETFKSFIMESMQELNDNVSITQEQKEQLTEALKNINNEFTKMTEEDKKNKSEEHKDEDKKEDCDVDDHNHDSNRKQ